MNLAIDENKMGKASIIVPIYNMEKYLARCIQSILGQTYANYEVILVDDGSSDNSLSICESYAQKDSRIKVIHQENLGQSMARNTGLTNVTGDYIVFVDPDDYVDKNLLRDALSVLENEQADMVAFSYQLMKGRKRGGIVHRSYCTDTEYIKETCLYRIGWEMWNKVYRRAVWNQVYFDPEVRSTTDLYIIPEVMRNVKKAVSIPGVYYFWEREAHGSLVQTRKSNSYYWEYMDWSRYPKFITVKEQYQRLLGAYRHIGALRALCKNVKDRRLDDRQKLELENYVGFNGEMTPEKMTCLLFLAYLVKEEQLHILFEDDPHRYSVGMVKSALKLYAVNSLCDCMNDEDKKWMMQIIRDNVSIPSIYKYLRWGILHHQMWMVHMVGRLMVKKFSH